MTNRLAQPRYTATSGTELAVLMPKRLHNTVFKHVSDLLYLDIRTSIELDLFPQWQLFPLIRI